MIFSRRGSEQRIAALSHFNPKWSIKASFIDWKGLVGCSLGKGFLGRGNYFPPGEMVSSVVETISLSGENHFPVWGDGFLGRGKVFPPISLARNMGAPVTSPSLTRE